MTENMQRTAYIFFLGFTSVVAVFLAFMWFMSPLGLGFATWPDANRALLEQIYQFSYYIGIPAILIAQILSPVLFAYRKRQVAYGLPVVSLSLFLACVVLVLASVNHAG